MLVDDKSQLENGNLRMGTIMKDRCINCNIMLVLVKVQAQALVHLVRVLQVVEVE